VLNNLGFGQILENFFEGTIFERTTNPENKIVT
jgi:hypothetical protein